MDRTKQTTLYFEDEAAKNLAMVLLNSNAFFWLWRVYGDGFDVTPKTIQMCPMFAPRDTEYNVIARDLYEAIPFCTVFKPYRGVNVPNVNFNKRMDLLWRADEWIIKNVAPDLDITPEDFLWSKSNSFFRMDIPKAANYPLGFDPGVPPHDDLA